MAEEHKKRAKRIWGWMLVIMGCAVFLRAHQLAPQIKQLAGSGQRIIFIYICIYIMVILLVGGGVKKIRARQEKAKGEKENG